MSRAFRCYAVLLCAATLFGFAGTAAAQGSSQGSSKQAAQNNVKTTHYNDWDVRCPTSGKDKNQCEMTQLIKSPKTGKPIMRVVMGYPPQINSAAMIFILPLGTRLAPGMQFSVDGGKVRRIPFQICLRQGCRADFPVQNGLLNKLKRGHAAKVTIVGPKGNKINLNISLSGFTAANKVIAK